MANRNEKNVPGPYYVTDACITCGMCAEVAPQNFAVEDLAYVSKQPADDVEKSACEEALSSCPVEAIGNDG
jgi:ferredoxin